MGSHGWHVGGKDGGGVCAGRSHGYVNPPCAGTRWLHSGVSVKCEHTMRGGPEQHSQAGGVKNLQNNATGMRGNTMNPGGSAGVHRGPAGSMGARGGGGAGVSAHGGAARLYICWICNAIERDVSQRMGLSKWRSEFISDSSHRVNRGYGWCTRRCWISPRGWASARGQHVCCSTYLGDA
jgi:hypothetical protein